MPAPFPEEFQRRAVELAREGHKPVAKLAEDLGISESGLRRLSRPTHPNSPPPNMTNNR